MSALIAFALLVQTLIGVPARTEVYDDGSMTLRVDEAVYALELGDGCDGMNVSEDVEVFAGSGNVAAISNGSEQLCNVLIGDELWN
jgi:hypothetical protein